MAQDISLFGASYSDVPSILLPRTGGGTALFTDTSDADATAADILTGKTAYVNGEKLVGTSSGGEIVYQPIALRPDAELVHSTTWDKMVVADLELEIPTYTTTNKVLRANSALDTYTADFTHYNYFMALRTLTIPEYSVTTKGKGREEYAFSCYIYEIVRVNSGSLPSLLDPTKSGGAFNVNQAAGFNRQFYWSSTTALAYQTAVTYAIAITPTGPGLSGSTITINSGQITIRGHATYLSSTYYNAITDARVQLRADIWRVPNDAANLPGWGLRSNMDTIIASINSSDHTLL